MNVHAVVAATILDVFFQSVTSATERELVPGNFIDAEQASVQLHDLRRTAKTLMQRAGVASHISERVLGHVIPGVEGVYDQYSYVPQKRDALERLAAEIGRILKPTPDNVMELRVDSSPAT